jgi:hypothetical protein
MRRTGFGSTGVMAGGYDQPVCKGGLDLCLLPKLLASNAAGIIHTTKAYYAYWNHGTASLAQLSSHERIVERYLLWGAASSRLSMYKMRERQALLP